MEDNIEHRYFWEEPVKFDLNYFCKRVKEYKQQELNSKIFGYSLMEFDLKKPEDVELMRLIKTVN